jgi:DNA polymerase-3 subunit delta
MIITIAGENDYLRQAEVSGLVAEFTKDYSADFGIERLEGEDVEYVAIQDAVQSLPFLSPKKLVILYEPSKKKKFTEEAETILKNVDDRVDLIIVEPKIDKRSTYYKYLKKNTDYREFLTADFNTLINWAGKYVKEKGRNLNSSDSRLLIERVGVNQLTLKNELDKLLDYNKNIDAKSIKEMTEKTPQSTIFELIDAAVNGDRASTIKLYEEQKAQKVEPQQIMALVGWQLHVLALIKSCYKDKEISANHIAEQTKLSPFVVRKNMQIANKLSADKLGRIIDRALKLDIRLKSESINQHEAIEYYLLSIVD